MDLLAGAAQTERSHFQILEATFLGSYRHFAIESLFIAVQGIRRQLSTCTLGPDF